MVGIICGGIFFVLSITIYSVTQPSLLVLIFFLGVEVAEKHMGGAELSDELVGMRKLSCEE